MIEDVAHRRAGCPAKPDVALNDGGAAGRHLQRTDQMITRIERIAADRKISDFTSPTPGSSDQPTVGDKAHSDPRPNGNERKGVYRAILALPLLTHRGEVHIILDDHVEA